MRHHLRQRRPHRRPDVLALEERTVLSLIGGEAFDGVVAPALPTGWTAQIVSGTPTAWATSTTTPPDTPPNAAFAAGPGSVADNLLISPVYNIPATGVTRLSFVHTFSLETGFDGGVLEISTNGGAFADLVTAGGSFAQGGYTGTISTSFSSPIGGRSAWTGTGTTAAPLTTVATLPGAASGGTAQFRWRLASDSTVASAGWRVDTVALSQPADLSITTSTPTFATGGPLVQTIVVSNAGPNAAVMPEVAVPFPAGLTPTSASQPGPWGVVSLGTASDPFVRFAGPASLASGASATLTVTYAGVNPAAETIYGFSAEVGSATFDPTPANNAAAATSVINSTLAPPPSILAQSFDGVTAPTLPSGWTATVASGTPAPWATTTAVANSVPNSAFAPNPATVSDNRLTSPNLNIPTMAGSIPQLTFRQRYAFESGSYDGGVLEVSTNGGTTFSDITAIGGSFVAGGYTGTILGGFANPLAGRAAWVNNTASVFITTTVNLPGSLAGGTAQFRWRIGTDNAFSATGWYVDTVRLEALGARADLSVAMAGPSVTSATEPTTFTITATNLGPVAANNVVVSVPIDRGSTFVSSTAPAGWTTTGPTDGLLTFTRPSFGIGSAVFTVTAIVPAAPMGSEVTASLRASIGSTTPDPTPTNNTAVSARRVIGLAAPAPTTGTTPQTTTVGSAFAVPLGVRLLDQLNSPITGVPITFMAPSSGASGTFPGMLSSVVVLTDANGFATAPALTANATRGGYTVTASEPGGGVASFALANLGLITGSFAPFGPAFEDVSTGPVTVATFSDPEAFLIGDYTATIDWFGNGSVVTPGTVTGSAGNFTVSGSYTFANPGTVMPKVILTNTSTGRTAMVTGSVLVTRDINSAVQITRSSLFRSPGTNFYNGTLRVKNISGNAIAGPLRLVITGLTAGVTLEQAPGTTLMMTPAGLTYILFNMPSPLAAGATANVPIRFSRPSPGAISYNVSAFADA